MAGLHPKVTASVVSGALTGLVVAELARRGIPIAADEAADLTVLISFAAGYFVPSNEVQESAVPFPIVIPRSPAPPVVTETEVP